MVDAAVSDKPKLPVQILFEGAQEVLGVERMQEVKNLLLQGGELRSPADETEQFLRVLEEKFQPPAVHGLALRIGRATFSYWLKYMGDQLGFRNQEYRLLPAPRRIDAGLQALAGVLGDLCGEDVILTDEGKYWQVVDRLRSETASACFLKIGLLQEFACWAGGGRFYPVTQAECRATGSSACIYRIDKKPLD
jgi:hypothetical protein